MDSMDTAPQPAQKNNSTLIIIAVILLIGVGIGAGLGFMFSKKGKNAAPDNKTLQQTAPQQTASDQPTTPPPSGATAEPAPPPPPLSIGFYGKVVKREGVTVTVQQILPPTTPGGKLTDGKLYTVTADEKISYINQKKTKNPKQGEPPFAPEPGSLAGLTKGLFVYIETSDDITGKTAVKANQVMYSVESPF